MKIRLLDNDDLIDFAKILGCLFVFLMVTLSAIYGIISIQSHHNRAACIDACMRSGWESSRARCEFRCSWGKCDVRAE